MTIFLTRISLLLCILLFTGCFKEVKIQRYTIYRSKAIEGVNLYGTEMNVQGFTDDVFFEIAKNQEFRINFVTISNKFMLDQLDRAIVDGVVTTENPTQKNMKLYSFSDSFFSFGPVLLLRSDDTLENFKALNVKVIGFGRYFGEDLTTREDLGYIFRPYDQIVTAIEELINSKIDAVVVDSSYGHQLESGLYASKIKIAAALFKVTKFRLAVKKESKNEELLVRFNKGLAELRANKTYDKMLEYWALYEPFTE